MEEKTMTREEFKNEHQETEVSSKRIRIRLIPIWLRILIVLVLIAAAAVSGAMVGYGIIGGGKALDVFEKSTWTHIQDLVNSDE